MRHIEFSGAASYRLGTDGGRGHNPPMAIETIEAMRMVFRYNRPRQNIEFFNNAATLG